MRSLTWWNGDPDRVCEHDLVRTGAADLRRKLDDTLRIDPALERAPEGRRDRHARAHAVLSRPGDDAQRSRDRVGDGGALVALVERLARGEGEMNLVEAGCEQPVVALLVERQSRIDDAGSPLDPGNDLLGAGHLGDTRRD